MRIAFSQNFNARYKYIYLSPFNGLCRSLSHRTRLLICDKLVCIYLIFIPFAYSLYSFLLLLLLLFFIDLFLSLIFECVCMFMALMPLFFQNSFYWIKYHTSHSHTYIFDSVRQTTEFLVR